MIDQFSFPLLTREQTQKRVEYLNQVLFYKNLTIAPWFVLNHERNIREHHLYIYNLNRTFCRKSFNFLNKKSIFNIKVFRAGNIFLDIDVFNTKSICKPWGQIHTYSGFIGKGNMMISYPFVQFFESSKRLLKDFDFP